VPYWDEKPLDVSRKALHAAAVKRHMRNLRAAR